jgi:hypothetical protein
MCRQNGPVDEAAPLDLGQGSSPGLNARSKRGCSAVLLVQNRRQAEGQREPDGIQDTNISGRHVSSSQNNGKNSSALRLFQQARYSSTAVIFVMAVV